MEAVSVTHDTIFKSSDKKKRGRPPLVARPVDFGCNECEKKFKRKVLMKEHMVTAHGKGSRYTCFICQRGFYSRNHMLRHVKGHEVAMQPDGITKMRPSVMCFMQPEDADIKLRASSMLHRMREMRCSFT